MKKLSLLFLCVLIAGCTQITKTNWQSAPEYRAYISTRLADAIIEYNTLTDETVIEEELCDGSGWITQGDGHKTECPGCSKCEKSSTAEECLDEQCPAPQSPSATTKCEPAKKSGPIKRLFGRLRK